MQERLQKVLARAGVASRRKAEEMIQEGRVEVDGRKVTRLGSKVDAARQMIRVDGVLVADIADPVYYVLFKPAGCVSTLSDPEGRPSLAEYAERLPERIFPVGRLDYDAEGALLLTNDGELAHRLMHPSFGAKRTYLAKVKGEVKPSAIDKLRAGVQLEDGPAKPEHASISSQALKNTWLKLVLTEGRTHLVKRLCEAVGHPVQRLFRSDYAGVGVDGMMPGELRELSSQEIKMLKAGGGTPLAATLPPRRDARRDPRGGIRTGGRKQPSILLSPEPTSGPSAAEVAEAQRKAAEQSGSSPSPGHSSRPAGPGRGRPERLSSEAQPRSGRGRQGSLSRVSEGKSPRFTSAGQRTSSSGQGRKSEAHSGKSARPARGSTGRQSRAGSASQQGRAAQKGRVAAGGRPKAQAQGTRQSRRSSSRGR